MYDGRPPIVKRHFKGSRYSLGRYNALNFPISNHC